MVAITESLLKEYENAGFSVICRKDGSAEIIPIGRFIVNKKILPISGVSIDISMELFVQCGLNILVSGPMGHFSIDPTKDTLKIGTPINGSIGTFSPIAGNNRYLRSGVWLINILHGLDRSTTNNTDMSLEKAFDIERTGGTVAIHRKFTHDLDQYSRRYTLRTTKRSSIVISADPHSRFYKIWKFIRRRKASVDIVGLKIS